MSFYTDVIMKDPRFHSPQRCASIALLEPTMRAAVLSIIQEASSVGTPLMIFETFRSEARQIMLYQQGATQLEKVGTHGYGLAADLVRMIDGQPSWKVDYTFLGPLAAKHGLVWGGSWAAFRDMDHVQRLAVADQPRLFAGAFYPDALYNPDALVAVA
jgi:hypothetical protein